MECNVSEGALSFVSKKRLAGLSSRFYSSFVFILALFLHFDRSCKSLKDSAGTSERRALLPELVSYMKQEWCSGKIALSGVSTVSISFPFYLFFLFLYVIL